jgi:endo-1,3(4)-beta-glucanase
MSNEQTSGERTHGRHDSGQQPLHRPIHDNKSNGTAQHYGIHCVEQDASTAKEAVPVQPPLSLDIFAPMSILDIPIPQCDNHPVSRNFIRKFTKAKAPLQTNKFYENFILGGQDCAVWTHPYSLSWAKGQGNAGSWGMAVSHIDREQLAFGPPTSTGAAQYYINPIGRL